MITSAPADCACRESRIASAVLGAPVCAITGTRPRGLVDDGLDHHAALVDGSAR